MISLTYYIWVITLIEKYINFSTLKSNREHFIKPMLEHGISMDLIIGNHDTYFKNTNEVNSRPFIIRVR